MCTYVLSQVLLNHHLDCHSHAHLQKVDKANSFFIILTMLFFSLHTSKAAHQAEG